MIPQLTDAMNRSSRLHYYLCGPAAVESVTTASGTSSYAIQWALAKQ